MPQDDDTRRPVGFDLYRVARIKEELDAKSRKPGRPRIYQEPRQDVRIALPVELIAAIDAATDNRTAFIEAAVREKLERSR